MFSKRNTKFFLLIPAILITVAIFLFPKEITTNEMPEACAGCSNKCKIKICTKWIPGPSAECPNPGSGGGCCVREEIVCDPNCEEEPPPPPDAPPTLSSSLSCSTWGINGWCIGSQTLDITATESKGRTMLLSGNVLGTPFLCNNGNPIASPASCSYSLPEGNATANFSATSSINLTSNGTQAWKRDITLPSLSRSFSELSNGYDWFKTAVNLTASASDSLSGIAGIEYSYNNANWSPYVSPLNFSDGSVTVYLRAIDNAGNIRTHSETIKVDSQAPQLSKTLTGTAGNPPWYVSDVQVEVFQTDPAPSSGIQYFAYTLDGASWVPYTIPFTITEGITNLQIQLVDYADNQDLSTDEIKVDTTPPSIGGSLDQSPNALDWFKKSVNLTATASDSTSGVASFQYSYDNASWTDYTTALNFVDGITTVYFQAEDIAGNQHRSDYEIKVDTQLPEVSHQISGTLGENGWYTSNVQVAVSESDPAPSSGTQFFQTSLDGVNWTNYTAPLDFVEGTYVLQMRVIDNADNQDLNGIALNVDTTPPTIQGAITGEFGENNFYNTAIEASVSVSDGTSGIAQTEYSLDGSAWLSYVAPLTIDDGFHKLQFRTKDVAGNYSYTEVYEFEVDTRGPNIKLPSRWYIWETGGLFVKDETSKIRNVTYEIRDGQNRWKKVERNWDPNRHEFTRDLDWNRLFSDGVRAPIGTYFVTIYAEDYAGNRSKKTAEIIIPGVNATPLPTFTPTPIPTNTPVPTEAADDNPTTMLPTVTATPFVFIGIIPPPAEGGDTPSTFGDTPQTPKEPLDANDLLAVTAAAATGAFIATQRKKETLTLEEEKADVEEAANDGILQGSAAAAAIAAFKAENEERMRREAAAAAARRADRKEKQARRDAEKAGRLDEYKRKKQEGREAAARAEEERLRQKDEDRRAAKKREQSGLSEKEWKAKEAQQAIWDANGRAIYDANQEFEEAYGYQMDAATREQAIKDATVGGVFNAGLYATNLQTSAQQIKEDDPYSGMEDYYESQDRKTSEEIDELRQWGENRNQEQLEAGLLAYYDGRKAGENDKYRGDVFADYMAGKDWMDAAAASVYGLGTRDYWTELEIRRANGGVPWNMEVEHEMYNGDVLADYMESKNWMDAAAASAYGLGTRDYWTELEVKRAGEGTSWDMEKVLEIRKRIAEGANEIEDEKKIDLVAEYMDSKARTERQQVEALEYGIPGPEEFSYGSPPQDVAFGIRFDRTEWTPIGGVDMNYDIMYFTNSKEIGFFVTPAAQLGIGGGADGSVGLLFGSNYPDADTYSGLSYVGGMNFYHGAGVEIDVSQDMQPNLDGSVPTTIYIGGGGGESAGFYQEVSATGKIISFDFGE